MKGWLYITTVSATDIPTLLWTFLSDCYHAKNRKPSKQVNIMEMGYDLPVRSPLVNQECSQTIYTARLWCQALVPLSGPVGFMGNGDLWGFNSIVLIFYKSRLGFMGIYGRTSGDINPHKFMGIYGKASGDINPHKSQPGFIKNQYYLI